MGGPARQENEFECRGDPPAIGRVIVAIDAARFVKERTAEPVRPRGQGIAFAHRAQVMRQMRQVAVTGTQRDGIRDRQRKAGPPQKPPEIADFAHRQHTRRQAAVKRAFRFGQTGAQFVQGAPARQNGDQKSIRPQGPEALDQLPDRIVRPMERHGVNDQVMRFDAEIQPIGVRHDPRLWQKFRPNLRPRGDHGGLRKPSVNLIQSLLNLKNCLFVQEKRGLPAAGAGAVAQKGIGIDQFRRCGHGAGPYRRTMNLESALHVIFPPACVGCGAQVASDFGLCGPCWRDMGFIAGLVCDRCGGPLAGTDDGRAEYCDDCLTMARPWDRGRAVCTYGGKARDLVLALKHADRLDLVRPLAQWMARAAGPILTQGMIVAPVPLHWTRLLSRRYNQSALLSRAVARLARLDHCPDVLSRDRKTGTQDGKGRDDRFANIAGAIRAHPRRRSRMAGRHVLLVDDVMTSGATLGAAADACLAAGAAHVSVLVMARVAKDA